MNNNKGGEKKIRLRPANTLIVDREWAIYCDFCGTEEVEVFTSSYSGHANEAKNETQICVNCVRELSKLLT